MATNSTKAIPTWGEVQQTFLSVVTLSWQSSERMSSALDILNIYQYNMWVAVLDAATDRFSGLMNMPDPEIQNENHIFSVHLESVNANDVGYAMYINGRFGIDYGKKYVVYSQIDTWSIL